MGWQEMEECCVCLAPTSVRVSPCQHALCVRCATKWFRVKFECPMCRQVPAGLEAPRKPAMGMRPSAAHDVVCLQPSPRRPKPATFRTNNFELILRETKAKPGTDSRVWVGRTLRSSATRRTPPVLRFGDEIIRINAIPIVSVAQAMQIWQRTGSLGMPANVLVRRSTCLTKCMFLLS